MIDTMTVANAMTRSVFAVSPETSLVTAARLLSTQHIGGAPVIDKHGRTIGVVTLVDLVDPDRDRSSEAGKSVFYRVTSHDIEPMGDDADMGSGVVADVMTPFVLAVPPDATLREAIKVMVTDNVHRLLVLDQGKLVGVISSMDVLRALTPRPS